MSVSLIINTCAAAPHAKHVLSSGKVPYSWRAFALRNFIIPRYSERPSRSEAWIVRDFVELRIAARSSEVQSREPFINEVIVAGEWEPGNGYTYVHVPPKHFNWADCIAQRQAGFEASTGDIVIFQHDDHLLDIASAISAGLAASETWDVISPARWTRLRDPNGERLNGGEIDHYIDGHCAIYRREVIERCPWKNVPVQFTMDVAHTEQIRAAGFKKLVWTNTIWCWDVEYGSTPWL